MIGNWTVWQCVKWNGEAYVFERVRAYRSWFGFIREKRERKSFPGLGEACSLAALNGEELMLAKYHYAKLNAVCEERNAAKAQADSFFRDVQRFASQLAAEKQAYAQLLEAVQATEPPKAKPARGRRARRK